MTTATSVHLTISAGLMKRKIEAARRVLLAAGIIANDGSGDPAVESLIYTIVKLTQGEWSVGK